MTRTCSIVLSVCTVALLLVAGCTGESESEPMASMTWAGLDISYPPDWQHKVGGETIHFSPDSTASPGESEHKVEFVVAVVWSGAVSADAVEGFADHALLVEKPKRELRARPVKVAACESFRVDAETGFARYTWVLTGRDDHRVLLYAWVHPPEQWHEYASTFEQMIEEISCLAWL